MTLQLECGWIWTSNYYNALLGLVPPKACWMLQLGFSMFSNLVQKHVSCNCTKFMHYRWLYIIVTILDMVLHALHFTIGQSLANIFTICLDAIQSLYRDIPELPQNLDCVHQKWSVIIS
ncbi:hypothetical protein CR513_21802, partial [Mucuna pruriens]